MIGYQDLLERVAARADLGNDDARAAIEAVLGLLTRTLDDGTRHEVAEALPGLLRDFAEAPGPTVGDAGTGDLARTLAASTGWTAEVARYRMRAVVSALAETDPGTAGRLISALPEGDRADLVQPLGQGPAPVGSGVPTSSEPTLLSDDEISRALAGLEGWTGDHKRLHRTVALPDDRVRALTDRVQRIGDEDNHHATIDEGPDGVTFTLWTHTVDAVTSYDLDLAARINDAVTEVGSHG